MKLRLLPLLALGAMSVLRADVSLPSLFSDHMVLQRDLADPVWGKAEPGEKVTVSINGQSKETEADDEGKWMVKLDPMSAGGPFQMVVQGENKIVLQNILVGEVWVCSGQSNMQLSINNSDNTAVEVASANYPDIRYFGMPRKGTQEPQDDTDAQWVLCSPDTVGGFSAVGYLFGRRIHQSLGVPVGLIHNAWGGSSAEAWVPRAMLEEYQEFTDQIKYWDQKAAEHTDEIQEQKIAEWQEARKLHAEGKGPWPRYPQDPRYNQHRPGNIYNGGILPIAGYGIRGMIWYQGESNAGRYQNYELLINMMVDNFRNIWGQGDFPFYFVQLADYQMEELEPKDTNWPRLREAQTKTIESLENSGQAVIIDVGEGRDIHPRNKQVVADRLSRWALANDYGYSMAYRSPEFKEMEIVSDEESGRKQAVITFDYIDDKLYAFDTKEVKGFAIAGEDQIFHWAEAEIKGKNQDRVVVWSDAVAEPVAVRYAWAMNPVANLYDRNGLPVTPFRTDDWPKPEDQ